MNSKFFPYLRTVTGNESMYHIDLFFEENVKEQLPIITFISEDDQKIGDLEEHGISGSELVKTSLNNIRALELPYVKYKYGCESILVIENQKHASEKILDKEFLRNAAIHLNATKIKVAVPVRNSILICDADRDESVAILNEQLHKLYNDFSREMISRLIFEVEDGIIKSAIIKEVVVKEIDWSKEFPESYEETITKLKLFGELYNIKLMVGADNIEDFQNGLFLSIQKVISTYKTEKDFNGTIEILTIIDKPEKNRSNMRTMKEFLMKLANNPMIIKLIGNHSDKIKLTFMFSEDFRNGDHHKKLTTFLN